MDTPGMSLIAERHPKAILEILKFSFASAAHGANIEPFPKEDAKN
jgi:hypothetical protein